jgi:lipoprotein-anchoring transpeptidase ErfK/SrfK
VRLSLKSALLVPFVLLVLLGVSGAAAAGAAAPLADPGLTVQATPATVVYGSSVQIRVHLAVPHAIVHVMRDLGGASIGHTLVTDAAGDASFSDTPAGAAVYRAEYGGDQTWSAAAAETRVSVVAKVSLSVAASGRVRTSDRVGLKIAVRPAAAAAPVEVQEKSASGSWRTLATVMPDAAGQARWEWRPTSLGSRRLRAVLAASGAWPAAVSSVRSVKVYDASDPYGIPATYAHLILVDLSKYRLFYYEHGKVLRSFDCVLGRPSLPTPRGHFKIYAKDPDMYGPYGPRRMRYLGLYAIHGTNEPWLLSRWPRNYSHGCTRLANADIMWLYERVHVGTPVWNVP